MRDKSLLIAVLVVALAVAPVYAQVSRPNPSPTPQPDPAKIGGVVKPSAQPSCAVKAVGVYGDPNGCLYACTDQRNTIIARGLGNPCVFPTTGATATPTPTPTRTPTQTPTPTPTATA